MFIQKLANFSFVFLVEQLLGPQPEHNGLLEKLKSFNSRDTRKLHRDCSAYIRFISLLSPHQQPKVDRLDLRINFL
jgi:hypothetical protein